MRKNWNVRVTSGALYYRVRNLQIVREESGGYTQYTDHYTNAKIKE